jgi:hypothetical protein
MKTKKPTYQELEEERDAYVISLIILFAFFSICFIFVCMIFNNSVEYYKSQLNLTEGKNCSCDFVGAIKPEDNRICEEENVKEPKEEEVDYHSSGKLFCEHYNGTYYAGTWEGEICEFIELDNHYICKLDRMNNRFIVFEGTCEAIK